MPGDRRAGEVPEPTPVPRRRRAARHLRWIVPLALVGSAVVALLVIAPGEDGDPETAPVTREFEEIIVTDLTEVTTFEGTLGFDEGDPISASIGGTLTSAAAEGAVIREGEILFAIDEEPVVLLYGDTTIWRDMGLLPEVEQLRSRAIGTVTWIADEGTTIEQGDLLMRIDDRPVIVLYGEVPAYRSLARNDEGNDVRQLETALVALGFDPDEDMSVDEEFTSFTEGIVEDWQESIGAETDGSVDLGEVVFAPAPFTIDTLLVEVGAQLSSGPVASIFFSRQGVDGGDVLALEQALARLGFDANGSMVADGVFDASTERAVRAWQEAMGMEVDGIVEPGDLVVLPGAVRISDRLMQPGADMNRGMAVLGTSTDESVVTVDLPAADQAVLDQGDRVVIVLPDDTGIGGTVALKAETASVSPQGEATFEVVIVLDDAAAAAGLDQAPVEVDVITDRADGVMAVPVTALLALAEGGYAVELEQPDGSTALVAVDPGMYADGMVEITSDAVSPGDRVVAP